MRRLTLPAAFAVLASALSMPALAGAAQAVAPGAPLPASNYGTHHLCALPAPGYMGCLALELVPRTAAARAHTHPLGITRRHALTPVRAIVEGALGFGPKQLHSAYNLPAEATGTPTVGIVDAYDDPTIEADLKTYDTEFHLSECTKENGCFKKVNQEGHESPLPATNGGWAGEISLDVEITHAICPNCHILLVEASSAGSSSLETAENAAANLGATEISNSWGGPEPLLDGAAFNHPGVVITAAAGDYGYLNWAAEERLPGFVGHPDYPASSPHVVAVGGTRLTLNAESKWESESIWNDGSTAEHSQNFGASGGGCSENFPGQLWQREVGDWSEVGCGTNRASNDVSADADPVTPVAVYDSTPERPGLHAPGWLALGGTSLSSPIIASTFALAGGSGGVPYPSEALYAHLGSSSLHDIVSGSNGKCTKPFNGETRAAGCTVEEEAAQCGAKLICKAASGYDGPSGVGTPNGVGAFKPPAPTVTAVLPATGNTGGRTTVKITGTHLLGASKVSFGEAPATELNVSSATEITVKSPAHAAATVDVTVTTAGGASALSAADHYTYVTPPAPIVTAVSPALGSTVGGNTVKITGTNLEDAAAVKFGEASATEIKEVSAGEITVKAPAHAEEEVDVTVATPGGTSATSVGDRYKYVTPPAPTVTGVSPAEGTTLGGGTVRITGTNLETVTAVKFGEAGATEVHEVSATEITVTSPAHAPGAVQVTVTTPGGTSATGASDLYTFVALPAVTGVSPAEGPSTGGTTVTITGNALEGASKVNFGTAAATEVKVVSATEIIAKSPAETAATVDVTVITPGGTSATSSADHFSFRVPAPEPTGPGPEMPGAGSASNLTVSPFAGTSGGGAGSNVGPGDAFSNFNVLGEQVNAKTGAIKLTVAVFHPGTLRWSLTFRNAGAHGARCARGRTSSKARCRFTTAVFGDGSQVVDAARIVTFTVVPGPAAKRALKRARERGGALAVRASLSYTAIGGSPIAQTSALSVRLKRAARGRRGRA
jgi:hypothetical protein